MPGRSKRYIADLSESDRTVVRLVKDGKFIKVFSVQYEALIEGSWRKLIRYDSAHGQPHRHTFRPDGNQRVQVLRITNLNLALTYSITTINKNFLRTRESYIILLEQDRRRS
jgi:hypothetical protein